MYQPNIQIIDITEKIKSNFNNSSNYYCFNNSLIHYRDNYYLMTYRVLYYNIKTKIHPWSWWWNGSKIFYIENPDLIDKVDIFSDRKHKHSLGFDNFLSLKNNENKINFNKYEFDGTGLAILKISDNFNIEIIYNINNIFEDDMNQDARIVNINNKFYITYNSFVIENDLTYIRMFKRKIFINLENKTFYLGKEFVMSNATNKQVEKNWILFKNKNTTDFYNMNDIIDDKYILDNNFISNTPITSSSNTTSKNKSSQENIDDVDILYSINGFFNIIHNNKLMGYRVDLLSNIIKYYKNEIYFSLSSPCIEYEINNEILYLSLGHVKINHKINFENSPFEKFLLSIDYFNNKTLNKHGKYIYFMFFFVFDKYYNLKYLSNAFIPTDEHNSHLPYLLVFPTGITKFNDKYIISYGEGDVKCKLLCLSKDTIDMSLININNLNPESFDFIFLKNKKKIVVLGYFDEYNVGDDSYKFILEHFNSDNISFYNPYKISIIPNDTNLILVSGGDLFNSYFINKIKSIITVSQLSCPVYALSVGIPYTSIISYDLLSFFNKIYLRNITDVGFLLNLGLKNVYHVPDMAFLLPQYINKITYVPPKYNFNFKKSIGFFIPRTIYSVDNEELYFSFITQISNLISLLCDEYTVILIPFDYNQNNNKENDIIVNKHIKTIFYDNDKVIDFSPFIDYDNYVQQLFSLVKLLKFGICMRFHSHVFCLMHNVPFISLSVTRKSYLFMKENNLLDYHIKSECDTRFVPFTFDIKMVYNKIKNFNPSDFSFKLSNEQIFNYLHLIHDLFF